MEDFSLLLLCFLFFLVPLLVLSFEKRQYKNSAYYNVTKHPHTFIRRDKGKYGEYLIYKRLQKFETDGGKFLFNIYIPKANNETSEIDILLICSKGLFVFESKNYSGWIFGNEMHKTWTQTFPLGKGKSHKEQFYNPIMQNASHVRHLMRLVDSGIPIRSVVVFSDGCTFKNVTINSNAVSVIKRRDVLSVVTHLCSQIQTDCLTGTKINDIYNKLYPYTQVSREVRAQHAWNIQKYLSD